jgi:hypothetical protein
MHVTKLMRRYRELVTDPAWRREQERRQAVGAASTFVVVWWGYGSNGTDTSSASVQGQRFGAAGKQSRSHRL